MTKKWFAGGDNAVKVKASGSSPGNCHRDARFITFHNEGVNRSCTPGHVESLARYVRDKNIYYHFTYCPLCGQWAQIIPVDHAARSMKGGAVCSAGNSANRHGINIQVCFAGYGTQKLPDPKDWKNAKKFKKIAKEWNIPPKKLNFDKQYRSKEKWCDTSRGYRGHQHGPWDDHHDIQENKFNFKSFKKNVLKID